MSLSMNLLNKLIVDTAVCQLAVDEFEHVAGQDNAAALRDAHAELATVKLALIRLIMREGNPLMLNALAEQQESIANAPSLPGSFVRTGIWKSHI